MLNEDILKIVLNDKTFSQLEAEKIVGSRNRLFELVGNGSIRAEKKPSDRQNGRWYCNAYDADIYKTAIDMVKADIHKLTIREKVESFLDDHIKENINDRYFGEDINHEIGLNGKNVDVHIHYYACDYRERDNGDYLTPSSGSGYIDTEYTVTVFDECGNEEFEFNGNFQI